MRRLALVSFVASLAAVFMLRHDRMPSSPVASPPAIEPISSLGADAALLETHNPLTGHAFTPEQVERIRLLREAMPDNALIPTTDAQLLASRAKVAAEQQQREMRIVAKIATDEEIETFYEIQRALVRDRIALAEYVLQEPGWEPGIYEKYNRILQFARGQIERIDQRQQASLALAR